jgi:hypothetical protein
VDSRSAVFATDTEELMEFLTANQVAKMLRDPTTEAYIYVVKSIRSESNETISIDFNSNDTFIHGSFSSISSVESEQVRKYTAEIK